MPPVSPQPNPNPVPTPQPAALPTVNPVAPPVAPQPPLPPAPMFLPAHQQPGIMTPAPTMQPYSQPIGPVVLPDTPKTKRLRKFKKIGSVLAVVLTLVSAGIGVSSYMGNTGFKYAEFTEATLGEVPGRQMSFVYPKQMVEESKTLNSAAYSHRTSEAEGKKLASTMVISTLYLGPITQPTIDAYKDIFVNKKDGYEEFTGTSKQQAAQVNMENLTYGNFIEFTNQNIAKAFVADFTFSVKGSNTKGSGRQMIIMGKDQIYIVGLAATEDVWSRNKSAWTTITNGIKIDI